MDREEPDSMNSSTPPPPPPLSSSIAHRALCAPSARATGNSEDATPTRSSLIPPQGNSGSRRAISAGHRTIPRRLAAACTVGVLALCASLYAAPVQAQTTFISNTGQTAVTNIRVLSSTSSTRVLYAQPFRTGNNSAGYILGSVVVLLTSFSSDLPTLRAEVRTNTAQNTPSSTVVATLTGPPSLPDGSVTLVDVVLTPPAGTMPMLQSDTTYHLVLSHEEGSVIVWVDASQGSRDTGFASGWSFPRGWRQNLDDGNGWSG